MAGTKNGSTPLDFGKISIERPHQEHAGLRDSETPFNRSPEEETAWKQVKQILRFQES